MRNTILFISLLAVSSVNAEDNNSNNIVVDDGNSIVSTIEMDDDSYNDDSIISDDSNNQDSYDDLVKVNNLEAKNEEDKVGLRDSSTDGTFSELSTLIESTEENGTLVLDKNYIYDNASNGISISKSLTIDGNGYKIDANQSITSFGVIADNVVLKNLMLINFKSSGLYGAISLNGSNVVLFNSTICNSSTNSSYSYGTLVLKSENASVINCTFENCSTIYGGAIYVMHRSTISNCNFYNNFANGGAALYVASGYVNLTNCSLINNNVFSEEVMGPTGGAIYWSGSYGFLDNCYFINNQALEGTGGAIHISGSCSVLNNLTFINNSATRYGGAISLQSLNATLSNCNFDNNSGNNSGGAIWWTGRNGHLKDSVFINNSQALYWQEANGLLNNCKFFNNSGNAVNWYGKSGLLNNSVFFNNSAYAVNWYGESGLLNNSQFSNDDIDCGSIFWGASNGLINNSYFNPDSNNYFGGAEVIKRNSTLISIENISFDSGNPTEILVLLKNATNDPLSYKNITFTFINGDDSLTFINKTNEEGILTIYEELFDLTAGNWTLNIIFEGTDNDYSSNATVSININPLNSILSISDINTSLNKTTSLVAYVNSENYIINEGIVNFYIDDEFIGFASVVDGVASLEYTPSEVGNFIISAFFTDSNHFNESDGSSNMFVNTIFLDLALGEGTVGVNSNFVVSVVDLLSNPVNDGLIKFYIDDNLIRTVSVVDGLASLDYVPLIAGDYIVKVVFTGSDNFIDYNVSSSWKVVKSDISLVISADDIKYGEEAEINVSFIGVKENFNSSLMIDVNGNETVVDVINGRANLKVKDLDAGVYKIIAYFAGDENYNPKAAFNILNVKKIDDIYLNVSIGDISYGEIVDIYYNFNYKINATILADWGESNSFVAITDGVGQLHIPNLNAGNYTIFSNFGGDNNYESTYRLNTFKVFRSDKALLNIFSNNSTFGENNTVNFELFDGSTGLNGTILVSIKSNIGAFSTYVKLTNGIETLKLSGLSAGIYNINASFLGDNNYAPINNADSFRVSSANTSINISSENINYGEDLIVNIDLYSNGVGLTELVSLNIDGTVYNVTVVDGKGLIIVPDLNVGSHYLIAKFEGNNDYLPNSTDANILVSKSENIIFSINASNINYGEYAIVNAYLIVNGILANGTIIGQSNNTPFVITVVDGKGFATIGNLASGSYVVNANLLESDTYKPTNASCSFTVGEFYNTSLNIAVEDISYGENATINFTLIADNGVSITDNISVFFSNEKHSVEVIDGKGSFDVNGLIPDGYAVVAYYEGNKNYNASIASSQFKVSKLTTIIEYQNMTTTAVDIDTDGRVGKYFYITLKDKNGNALANKHIQIGFNGNVYDRDTDDKGSARLQINLKNAGTYTFAVCFLDDENYTGSFVVAKIVVNKQKGSLTVPNKSYSASASTKSLTATFKSASGKVVSGKKITFTVNGKSYSATTNANGVATVKVSLNKKGTYKFTAKFEGNTMYAAMTKTATLTIK